MAVVSFCVCVLCKHTHWAVDNGQNAATRYFNHKEKRYATISNYFYLRVRVGAVGWEPALQAEGRGFDSRFAY
jgi:hypothetical protein